MGLLNQLSMSDKKSPIDQTKQFYSENKRLVRILILELVGKRSRMGCSFDGSAERGCCLLLRPGASHNQLRERIRIIDGLINNS